MADLELRLDRYIYAVWRAKWLILLLTAIAAGITAFLGLRQPALHTANALLQVGRVWKENLEDPNLTAEVANSDGFIDELSRQTGVRSGLLRRSLQTDTIKAGHPRTAYPILVRVTATTEDPSESVRFARAAADLLLAKHEKKFEQAIASHLERQRRLEQHYSEFSKSGAAPVEAMLKLEAELDQVRSANLSPAETSKSQLTGEIVPGGVRRPPVLRNTAAAGVIALLAGIGMALVAGHFSKVPETNA
jgi:hypothetical protein